MLPFLFSNFRNFKNRLGLKTYQVELAFIALVLSLVNIYWNKPWVEWLGALAVLFTFAHAQIAFRASEKENELVAKGSKPQLECYWKSKWFFILKETSWFSYFILVGAASPLIGIAFFILYPFWRKLWNENKHGKSKEIKTCTT